MYIKKIKLNNFRTYGRLELDVGPSVNIVYGQNGQGKTNLVEAINVCCSTSSHKTSKDRDLIKLDENEYEVYLNLHDDVYNSDTDIFCAYYSENSSKSPKKTAFRELKHDGIKLSKASEYMGICNTVIFAPEDLNIVKGAPLSRRKYFNMLICKISPYYCELIGRTNRAIEQKNAVLKSLNGDISKVNDPSIDFWDFTLADLSAEVIMYRYKYSLLVSQKAHSYHSTISNGVESLSVDYITITGVVELLKRLIEEKSDVHTFISGTLSEAIYGEIKAILSEYILTKLKNVRKNDIEKRISSIGVNKDDLDIKLNNLSMRSYSSQGQQRSAALALKFAELEIIKEHTSSTPILILDDVFSELDRSRRVNLIAGMKNAQIFITCTDKDYILKELSELFEGEIDTRYFCVTKGIVTPDS